MQIIGADPVGSVYSGGSGRPYLVEGVGEDFWPTTYDPSVVDRVIAVSDADSFADDPRAGRAPRACSSAAPRGMAVVAAHRVAAEAGARRRRRGAVPDGGRGYLSKIFDDRWMADYGFLDAGTDERTRRRRPGPQGHRRCPSSSTCTPTRPSARPSTSCASTACRSCPVVRHEPPVMAAEVVGSVDEQVLLRELVSGAAQLDDALEAHMSPPLPLVGAGEPLSELRRGARAPPAVLVLDDGRPRGVLTSQDVLGFLAGSNDTDADR